MAEILIIDDDPLMCKSLERNIRSLGHDVVCAHTANDGRQKNKSGKYDLILLDVQLPDGSGLDLLSEIRKIDPHPEVIIITSAGNPDGAEIAVKNGAWDYIQKPFRKNDITLQISRVIEYRDAIKAPQPPVVLQREHIIGSSYKMKECLELLAQSAVGNAVALLTGETGTGKELFARAIHENSPRRDKSFIVVDCGALPETLLESQLFGYKKGAFTGADSDREGLVKQADGGTLFLDEIGELPMKFQKAFLRVLQERRFRPLSAKNEERSDFKLVCATNRNLKEMAKKGAFRSDLLFRIQQVTIHVPPLRDHAEDINELVNYHIAQLCTRDNRPLKGISQEFLDALAAYDWPGNIRELINALEWTLKDSHNDMIVIPRNLPEDIRVHLARSSIRKLNGSEPKQTRPALNIDTFPSLRGNRDEAEKQYLQDLISLAKGDIQKAGKLAGVTRQQLYNLLKKHGLTLQ